MCSNDVFLVVLAILFPPLPVWVKSGLCSADSLLNILLCVLGYFPGLLHSWYIISKYPDPLYEYESFAHRDHEGGRVTYVYVQSPPPQNGMDYGTARAQVPSPARPQQQQQQQQPQYQHHQHQQYQEGGAMDHGEGRSNAPPPTYAQAIAGDHKIQTHD